MYRSIFAAILAVTSAGAYASDGADRLEKSHSRVSAQAGTSTGQQSAHLAQAKQVKDNDYPPT
ncbi:hypothetical protein [Pseudomonas serbica]|jgi:hypothetical protein|uniref:hypothetical protein n=1 Tax=Pseudomonas serbica TaxID=2965074 RepID=UPI00237BE742|nr:hypothetical protein [Pseudomonas serbica]